MKRICTTFRVLGQKFLVNTDYNISYFQEIETCLRKSENDVRKKFLTTKSLSDIIVPKVIDMTGPIKGETNIAAVIFGALFSINPRAAKEL